MEYGVEQQGLLFFGIQRQRVGSDCHFYYDEGQEPEDVDVGNGLEEINGYTYVCGAVWRTTCLI